MRKQLVRHLLEAAESLIISPKTTFKIYGENVVVPVLVDFFGVDGVERLLDEEAIDFILWRELVTYNIDDLPGINPLQSGVLNTPAHSDPNASAELGMRWNKKLSISDAKRLAEKVAERTRVPPQGVAMSTVGSVFAAFSDGRLRSMGFDPASIELMNMPAPQRAQLCKLAEETMTAAILFQEELDLYGSDNTWHALTTMLKRIASNKGIFDTIESILRMERLPSIPALISNRVITWKDVLDLRQRPETQDFRRWLWAQEDPADKNGVTDRYLALMMSKSDRALSKWRKAARISVSSLAGTALGMLVAGPIGGIVGGVASTVVSTGVSLFDGLAADKLLGRTNPRRFATDVLGPMMAAAAKATTRPTLVR